MSDDRRPGLRSQVFTRCVAIRHPPLGMRDDLDLGVRSNDGERRIIEIVIGFALVLLARLPPHLDDADLRQQRVLDEGIQHDKAGILLHEDVIDVIRLLLGGGNILRPDRLEPHHLVARREDVHQRRHQPFHRVGDIGRHRLRPAVRRRHVARHVAEVVVERGRALLRQLGRRHRGQGIGLLRGEQRAQIGIGHFRHGGSGLQLHGTQRRASDASKGLSGQLWRECSPSRHAVPRRQAVCPVGRSATRALARVALQTSGLFRCGGSRGRRHVSLVVGSGFPEIGDTRRHHAHIVVIRAEPGVALAAEQPTHPAGGVGMIDAKRLLWRLPADAAHAALLAPAGLRTVPWRSRRSVRAGAKNPIAFSPSFCAAGARYPSPCGRRDRRDFPPCAALDIPHLPHIAFFAFHSRHFCRVAMSFSPQSNRRFARIRNQTPRADARAEARRRSKSESVETGFLRNGAGSTRAAGSPCSQPLTPRFTRTCRRYVSTRGRAHNHRSSAHHTKAFRPGMLEP